jgi:hypothetical protein
MLAIPAATIPGRHNPKLEKRVCKCYAAVKKEYDRLLPDRIAN